MNQLRIQIQQRLQDKAALEQAWVWDGQVRFSEYQVVVESDIEVYRPGRPARARLATQLLLNGLEMAQQLSGRESGGHTTSGVEVAGRRGRRLRLGLIECGDGLHLYERS